MLWMGPAGHQRNPHIRNFRTGKDTDMTFFFQMGAHKTLPVFIQHILAAVCFKYKTAPHR